MIVGAAVTSAGTVTFSLSYPAEPSFCGITITVQYAEFVVAACPLLLSDGLAITIGN